MKTLIFTLTAQQPLLMTSFQGDPNSDVSYSYIPGSTIRGALIGRYLRQKDIPPFDPTDSTVHRLFFDDRNTRYLNGYVSDLSYNRTLPIPFSWLKEKEDSLSQDKDCSAYDMAASEHKFGAPKSVGEGFWSEDDGIRIYRPLRRMNIHTQRDRTKGRATKANGQVFRYESLEAGQTFSCAIACHDDDASTLQGLLKQSSTLWIGGSRSAGYGKTTISNPKIEDNWQEASGHRAPSSTLTVTLLSHTLLRDKMGQPVADAAAVGRAIAQRLPMVTLPTHTPDKTFLKREPVGGFNRKWGLPLPQRVAIAQGSVVAFENVALSDEQRRQLESTGIGERCVEGFGRIAINYGTSAKELKVRLANPAREETVSVNATSTTIAEDIAKNILRQRLEQVLIQATSRNKLQRNHLSNSQLSRLELAARQGLQSHSFEPVERLLEKKNLTKTALRQFERSRLNNKPFYDQLQTWIGEKSLDWLNPYNGSSELTVTISDGISCSPADDAGKKIATDYTLRLIMAVAKQAKKETAS